MFNLIFIYFILFYSKIKFIYFLMINIIITMICLNLHFKMISKIENFF